MPWRFYIAKGLVLLVLLANVSRGWILSLSPDTKCGKCSTKQVGESMTFTCAIVMETGDSDTAPSISLRWLDQKMRPIKRVTFNTLYRVYTNQTTNEALYLHITHIKESDAGSYTCEGQSSQSGSVLRRSTSLVVIKDVKIQFLETPETQYPRVNVNALIRCLPEANPQPVTTWFFKGQPLVGGSRYTIAENGLIIHRLTREDEGTYTCKAEIPSENRSANRTITVIPASTPMINKPLNDVIGAFDQVRVKCMASGKPVPNYHWFKSGSADTLNEPKFHVDNTTGVLIINNLTRADEGKYICIASNPAGDTIATVDVKNVTEIPTAKLVGQTSARRGDNLTLHCDVTGYPPPRVVWHLPGHSLRWLPETISADSRITIQWRNTTRLQLVIKNVSSSDGGDFFCSVENMGGSQNASINVIITGEHSRNQGIPSPQNSSVLHAAWGATLGIIIIVLILVIGSIFIRRHRKGQRMMSSNLAVCSSCLVCIKDNKSQRSSSGGTLQNTSSKEKIAFSELIDTPENSRKESLSIISPNSPCGKDNDISADIEEKDTILQVVEYDNNLNEGKPIKKIEMKEGGYTELPLV